MPIYILPQCSTTAARVLNPAGTDAQFVRSRCAISRGILKGFNRRLQKVTKSKSVFPTDHSLLKMLYLAMMDITKKWTGGRQDWSLIHAQLSVFFADRMPD